MQPLLEKDRGVTRRILVIDATTPRPDHDAGSLLKFYHLKLLQSLGYQVTFIPDNLLHDGEYTRDLQRLGIECIIRATLPLARTFHHRAGWRL